MRLTSGLDRGLRPLRWAHGFLAIYSGDVEAGLGLAMAAVEHAREDGRTAARARILIGMVQAFVDPAGAEPVLTEAVTLAYRAGDDWGQVEASQVLAYAHLFRGRLTEAVACADVVLAALERLDHGQLRAWDAAIRADAAATSGRYAEAEELARRGFELAVGVAEPVSAFGAMTPLVRALVATGRTAEARAVLTVGLAVPRHPPRAGHRDLGGVHTRHRRRTGRAARCRGGRRRRDDVRAGDHGRPRLRRPRRRDRPRDRCPAGPRLRQPGGLPPQDRRCQVDVATDDGHGPREHQPILQCGRHACRRRGRHSTVGPAPILAGRGRPRGLRPGGSTAARDGWSGPRWRCRRRPSPSTSRSGVPRASPRGCPPTPRPAVGRHVQQADVPVGGLVAAARRAVGEERAVAVAQVADDVPLSVADPRLHAPHRVPRLGVAHERDEGRHLVPPARGQDRRTRRHGR